MGNQHMISNAVMLCASFPSALSDLLLEIKMTIFQRYSIFGKRTNLQCSMILQIIRPTIARIEALQIFIPYSINYQGYIRYLIKWMAEISAVAILCVHISPVNVQDGKFFRRFYEAEWYLFFFLPGIFYAGRDARYYESGKEKIHKLPCMLLTLLTGEFALK